MDHTTEIDWDQLRPLNNKYRRLGRHEPEGPSSLTAYLGKTGGKSSHWITRARVGEPDMKKLGWVYGDLVRLFIDRQNEIVVLMKDECGVRLTPYSKSWKPVAGQMGAAYAKETISEELGNILKEPLGWIPEIGSNRKHGGKYLLFRKAKNAGDIK